MEHDILNKAMCAYIKTLPSRDRLAQHIEKSGLLDRKSAIEAELDAAIKTAEDFLWKYPGGVPWTEEFEKEYRQVLSKHHPWLDESGSGRLMAFSRWYCWHEGLNAEE